MRRMILSCALAALSALCPVGPVRADAVIDRVVDDIALPGVAAFVAATARLADAAATDCRAANADLLAAWHGAMDAWFTIADLRFGPLENQGRRQAIAYWPDVTGHRPRALARILSGQDPILATPDAYDAEPVSARGLYAVEAMLFDPRFNGYDRGDPGCALVQAASADMAQVAVAVAADWRGPFAALMRGAGAAGNARFLDVTEARQAAFTALMTSLQFDIDERLGLPMGSFDHPRPTRAEGRLSGRAQRNLGLSLAAHRALATALAGDAAPRTLAGFDRVRALVARLDDPVLAGVADPVGRFRLEALQTALAGLRATANAELSELLGVRVGLNALDGD